MATLHARFAVLHKEVGLARRRCDVRTDRATATSVTLMRDPALDREGARVAAGLCPPSAWDGVADETLADGRAETEKVGTGYLKPPIPTPPYR